MKIEDFKDFPKKVWINNPSSLQPYHTLHAKVGIGVYKKHKTGFEEISIYFTEGDIKSLMIDPIHLEIKN